MENHSARPSLDPKHCHSMKTFIPRFCPFVLLAFILMSSYPSLSDFGTVDYVLPAGVHEIPEAFTGFFSVIPDEENRRIALSTFHGLSFAPTGSISFTISDTETRLVLPLIALLSPPWTNHPVHHVSIRFANRTGTFIPEIISQETEESLVGNCLQFLQQYRSDLGLRAHSYSLSRIERFGELASLKFLDQTMLGWGVIFWVDLQDPALLDWKPILPPEENGS